ncbi:aprataxin-like protein [Bachmanniomyces sp. S44760]|nr:aprataxin-like protein [Bachmanniomyces sp. S44760]
MGSPEEPRQDAITEEEIQGTAVPGHSSIDQGGPTTPPKTKPNACTALQYAPSPYPMLQNEDPITDSPCLSVVSELMSSKSKALSPRPSPRRPPPPNPTIQPPFIGRDGLGAYIYAPEEFPPSRVIYHNASFVTINDLYPKSSVHVLLLPRDPAKSLLHPFIALEDPVFLASVREEAEKAKKLVAGELRRRYGSVSTSEVARRTAQESEDLPDILPPGRDWLRSIVCGIHAGPSMNHLHIHILSVDRVSPCMKHRKHYNSFATPFFVPLEDFPLDRLDERRHPGREGYLERELKCWRCGKGFSNKFGKLKAHLEEEFDAWKRE